MKINQNISSVVIVSGPRYNNYGAHHNLLVNNAASNNEEYDIELAGETALFGFCTPTCYNNIVIAGRHHNILINDFGLNNIVIGGIRVNNPIVPCTL